MLVRKHNNLLWIMCRFTSKIFILIASTTISLITPFGKNNAICSDYYLVEQPYRQSLKQYYHDKAPTDSNDEELSISNIDEVYLNKMIEINNEEQNYQTSQTLKKYNTIDDNVNQKNKFHAKNTKVKKINNTHGTKD